MESYIPNVGTVLAVGGAASTKIRRSTMKLPKVLMAEIKRAYK